jgi:signal transduction histidine kinase
MRLRIPLPAFDSLAARTIAVVLLGIGLLHIVSLWTYQQALKQEVEQLNEIRLADRLVAMKKAVMRATPEDRETVAHELSGGPFEAHWSLAEHASPGGPGAEQWQGLGPRLIALAPELADGGLIIGANRAGAEDPHLALISMQLPDRSWLNVSLVSWGGRVQSAHGALLSTTIMALGAILASVLLVRLLTRPLAVAAEAAKRFTHTALPAPLPEEGPAEVRSLARAFNDMQKRIASLVNDRTQALAAVSHDLKTPITRLRFRMERISDEALRQSVSADLDEMERMIEQTLAYLRESDVSAEEAKPVDVVAILESISGDMVDTGSDITVAGAAHAIVEGRRLPLKRALTNLIDNAVKYGGRARITVRCDPNEVQIDIVDDGPGIPRADWERALTPFLRLEPSRNLSTGGFGLGLAIAHAIVEGHGGTLALGDSSISTIVVRLPHHPGTAID